MRGIAERITGMTKEELREYNFPSAKYGKEFFGTTHRNVRVFTGLIFTPENLDKERKRLRDNIPGALR